MTNQYGYDPQSPEAARRSLFLMQGLELPPEDTTPQIPDGDNPEAVSGESGLELPQLKGKVFDQDAVQSLIPDLQPGDSKITRKVREAAIATEIRGSLFEDSVMNNTDHPAVRRYAGNTALSSDVIDLADVRAKRRPVHASRRVR